MLSELQKWLFAFYSSILFLIMTSPITFKFTNMITRLGNWDTSMHGCPNIGGLFLHTVIFLVLVRVLMFIKLPGLPKRDKDS
jgi:hypothetical protein